MQLSGFSLRNDANLKAYWKLENVNDELSAYPLTNSGSVAFETAKYTNGARCDNPGTKKLSTSSLIANFLTGSWSVAGWAKLLSSEAVARQVWGSSDNNINVSAGFNYDYDSGAHRLDFYRDRSGVGTAHAYYSVELDLTMFHHFAMTYDGTTIRGYYDGAEVASTTQSGTGSSGVTPGFALSGATSGTNGFNGILDDWAVFNRVLTATEVRQLYVPESNGFIAFL